jgi:C4-type Zn-finger protein
MNGFHEIKAQEITQEQEQEYLARKRPCPYCEDAKAEIEWSTLNFSDGIPWQRGTCQSCGFSFDEIYSVTEVAPAMM